jgi:hypothetical protein
MATHATQMRNLQARLQTPHGRAEWHLDNATEYVLQCVLMGKGHLDYYGPYRYLSYEKEAPDVQKLFKALLTTWGYTYEDIRDGLRIWWGGED